MNRLKSLVILLLLLAPINISACDTDYSVNTTVDKCITWCGLEWIPNNNDSSSGTCLYSKDVVAKSFDICPSQIYVYYSAINKDSCSFKSTEVSGKTPILVLKSSPSHELTPSTKYDKITVCGTDEYLKTIAECGCMPTGLTDLTKGIYNLLKIAAPALLLVIGGFDLIKAMGAQDEKAIKKSQQKLIKKFVAAVAVYLIFTLVQFLVSLLANDPKNTLTCVNYLLNGYKV